MISYPSPIQPLVRAWLDTNLILFVAFVLAITKPCRLQLMQCGNASHVTRPSSEHWHDSNDNSKCTVEEYEQSLVLESFAIWIV